MIKSYRECKNIVRFFYLDLLCLSINLNSDNIFYLDFLNEKLNLMPIIVIILGLLISIMVMTITTIRVIQIMFVV